MKCVWLLLQSSICLSISAKVMTALIYIYQRAMAEPWDHYLSMMFQKLRLPGTFLVLLCSTCLTLLKSYHCMHLAIFLKIIMRNKPFRMPQEQSIIIGGLFFLNWDSRARHFLYTEIIGEYTWYSGLSLLKLEKHLRFKVA